MIFKVEWEKTRARVRLSDELFLGLLSTYYREKNAIKSVSIIEGGCSNINVLVHLNRSSDPVILRIHLQAPCSGYKEEKIASLLQGILPIPKYYHIGKALGYTFSIIEYLPGQALSQLLLNSSPSDFSKIMFKVGQALGTCTSIKFPSAGLFDHNLEITECASPKHVVNFCLQCLEDANVNSVLTREQKEKIKLIFTLYIDLLPTFAETNLVHADFDPANILVTEKNGEIEISGIIDWEFAFAGSPLWDVANMLRYAHQMPENFQVSFLQGLQSTDYHLPGTWQTTVHLLNITSLLDCLKRSDQKTQPKQIRDIKNLISHILDAKCWSQ